MASAIGVALRPTHGSCRPLVTISVSAPRLSIVSAVLTMLDVGPNGDITVIFPNKFHRDNFIRAGVTYQVPSPNYGFEFDVIVEFLNAIVANSVRSFQASLFEF